VPRGKKRVHDNSAEHATFLNFKNNARRRGIRIEISKTEWKELVIQECYYCGDPGSNLTQSCGHLFRHNGIDRLNKDLGYIEGNVVPCCKWCNTAKMSQNEQEFLDRILKIYHHRLSK